MKLKLDQIRRDDSAQPRAMLNTDHIKDLTDALGDGGDLTPVDVFHDGFSYWLADGFHRFNAYRRAKRDEMPVTVHEGELRDAVLFSITTNARHAVLKLTREEKRAGVERLLRDKEWSKWSNREIARRAGVDHKTVGVVREEVYAETQQTAGDDWGIPQSDLRKGADGRTINTANIGSKPKADDFSREKSEQPTPPLNTYTPPLTPEQPEEDDRPEYDPYADEPPEAEIVTDETEEDDEPYIPPYLNNPIQPTYPVKSLSNERKPKEPPFVMWYTLLGKVRSQGHRSLIDALNSIENQTQEQALENQVLDLIEMLRASLKQAEKERKTLEVTA